MAAGDSDSDSSKVELIVSKFFSKCIHVILESRYTNAVLLNKATSDDVVTTADKFWFNLILRDIVPPGLFQVTDVSSSVEIVVDLVLLRRTGHCNGHLHSTAALAPSYGRWDGKGGRVIERWVMMFEGNNGRDNTGRFKVSSWRKTFYKKCVLMLRSLCVMVKLLPAYKLFRQLTASLKPSEFSLVHHISSFAEPFTRQEEAQLEKYLFNPVETPCGSLCLSVFYLSSLGDLTTTEPCYHMLPHLVIPDYCKAPKLYDNRMVTCGTAVSVKRQLPIAEAALSTSMSSSRSRSRSLDSPSYAAKTPSHAARSSGSLDHLRCEAPCCMIPEELRDPFQPRLSDDAVIGSMFSIFSTSATLRGTSAFTANRPDLQAESVSVPVPTNGTVKTTSDALRELKNHIDFKKRVLQRTSNIVSHSAASRLSAGQDSTPGSK